MSSLVHRLSLAECGVVAALCFGALACQSNDAMSEAGAPGDGGPSEPVDPIDPATLPALCRRERDDPVRDIFCKGGSPGISSLRDLQSRLKLALPREGSVDSSFGPLVVLGHSTALSAELVSPLNPRVIIVAMNTALAFNRGVQQVEIATRDYETDELNFFLVSFEQSCNAMPGGCTPGDLYSPRIESDWTSVRIEDDEDLKNTPSDCRQCHQRGRDTPVLLMREIDGPWTHFFMPEQAGGSTDPEPAEPSGVDLLNAYLGAKGDETYAGVPSTFLRSSFGFTLELAVEREQPLFFDVTTILSERWPWTPEAGYASAPLPSATWYRNYEAFKRGEQLALPHFAPMPTDPEKQARLSAAYSSYRAGAMGVEELPDLADIFPDDPEVRAEIGLQTSPDATPAEALVQACGSCHNDVLDQSISRARFNIDLARMSRSELDLAIERLKAEPGAEGAMPPLGRRRLEQQARAELIAYLESNVRSNEDDALLGRAAQIGMMGGGK